MKCKYIAAVLLFPGMGFMYVSDGVFVGRGIGKGIEVLGWGAIVVVVVVGFLFMRALILLVY